MGQQLDRRLELQALLQSLMPIGGMVYFQPSENIQLLYPAIIYSRDNADTIFADNFPWKNVKRYLVTVIDQDPDSEIPEKIAALPMSQFQRHFTSANLNHDVFNLYF